MGPPTEWRKEACTSLFLEKRNFTVTRVVRRKFYRLFRMIAIVNRANRFSILPYPRRFRRARTAFFIGRVSSIELARNLHPGTRTQAKPDKTWIVRDRRFCYNSAALISSRPPGGS